MTAEIAILNKTAIALAADSAVTISTGNKEDKIFNSADKLFELSNKNPLGIMIYNDTSFMETPLPSLIKQFRTRCCSPAKSVEEAAKEFLSFLDDFGRSVPQSVKDRSIQRIVWPFIIHLRERIGKKIQMKIEEIKWSEETNIGDIGDIISDIINTSIDVYERAWNHLQDAKFIGDGDIIVSADTEDFMRRITYDELKHYDNEQKERVVQLTKLALRKHLISGDSTGIVIAGFGDNELFPTLLSFELHNMVCDRLKYVQTNTVQIAHEGARARVIPFAQKEMVERFLYGLDDDLEDNITSFCRNEVRERFKEVLDLIEFDTQEGRTKIEEVTQSAAEAFVTNLKCHTLDTIRAKSRAEIENMVEFMPKPELAQMAEALVDLTSIKRRVSRGFETVGGPIDVAVICQSEGFVWVRRKHYFPSELNARYFLRLNSSAHEQTRFDNGEVSEPRKICETRRGKASKRVSSKGNGKGMSSTIEGGAKPQ